MATPLPKLRARFGEGIGVELFFAFPDLQGYVKTYLDADVASGVSSLSANALDFNAGDYIVVGQPGSEKTEIIRIDPNTAPTATTITLASAISFSHNRGDLVRFIPYNQIEPQRSTNAGTSYSALSIINIRADASETYLQRSGDAATDLFKFRFYNSASGLYSGYSDPILSTGYGDNTIWSIKQRALNQLGEKRSDLINDQFLNDAIMEARRIADQNPAVLRWSFRTKFGATIGQMLAGQWSIAAPSDLRDRNSFKNILSLRFGSQNRPVVYQDRRRFNQNYLNVVHTTNPSLISSGATSMTLTSTHDLDTAGSLTIGGNSPGDLLMIISYSGNNKSTNTLTGVSGVTRNISAGTDCWQRAVLGTSSLPSAFTIDAGMLYFDVPVGNQWDGQDMKGDYYSAIPTIDSDADTFDEPFYDLYVPYLKFKIKYLKANGKIDRDKDTDWEDWQNGLAELISQEVPGQHVNFVPDVEGFLSAVE